MHIAFHLRAGIAEATLRAGFRLIPESGDSKVIGWGRQDRVCFVSQARRAQILFPDARLHWFAHSGHFPHWHVPQETVELIFDSINRDSATTKLQ